MWPMFPIALIARYLVELDSFFISNGSEQEAARIRIIAVYITLFIFLEIKGVRYRRNYCKNIDQRRRHPLLLAVVAA